MTTALEDLKALHDWLADQDFPLSGEYMSGMAHSEAETARKLQPIIEKLERLYELFNLLANEVIE